MKAVAGVLCLAVVLAGCRSGGGAETKQGEGKPPKPAPKMATLYVESKGEPINAGGKHVEKSDIAGNSKGSFEAKDLVMPGMFLLVTAATTAGGALLIRALDKKDKSAGPTYVATGGAGGTYVPVELPAPAAEAPPPSDFTAIATAGDSSSTSLAAAGTAVVSTPTSILLSMGYASDFSGPSYVKVKSKSEGPYSEFGHDLYLYYWELTVDRSAVSSGEEVEVFASFTGIPPRKIVMVRMQIPEGTTFVCDHAPLLSTIPLEGLGAAWYFASYDTVSMESGAPSGKVVTVAFEHPGTSTPIKLGHLTIVTPVTITADSTLDVSSSTLKVYDRK